MIARRVKTLIRFLEVNCLLKILITSIAIGFWMSAANHDIPLAAESLAIVTMSVAIFVTLVVAKNHTPTFLKLAVLLTLISTTCYFFPVIDDYWVSIMTDISTIAMLTVIYIMTIKDKHEKRKTETTKKAAQEKVITNGNH